MSALITMALASAWVIPAATAALAGIVAGWFGGDWALALIAALTVGAAVLAYRRLGLKGALAVLSAGAAIFAYRSGERRGAAGQAAKEKADADRSVDRAQRARADADRRNADPKRLRDDDGFRRD
ncbi:hypothetical protein [Xanthobacter autotrophicus]|uniref:hypothetical protein n=1 Tax=Xanthobacter autotrophicus TaxID=280 RepID=UPI0037278190